MGEINEITKGELGGHDMTWTGDEPMTPIEAWADACEGAIRTVEMMSFEEQGKVAVEQAWKLVWLARKLAGIENEPERFTADQVEPHTNSDDSIGTWARCPYCGEDYCVESDSCLTSALARVAELEAKLAAVRELCEYDRHHSGVARRVLAILAGEVDDDE